MEGDISLASVGIELDVQRSLVGGEGKTRCDKVGGACLVSHGAVLRHGKLRADSQASIFRDFLGVPDGEALGVAVILALVSSSRAIKVPVEVELLARVVLMDVSAVAGDTVNGVLDTVDAASDGVLSDTNRVTETPTKDVTRVVKVIRLGVRGQIGQVEGTDLRETGTENGGCGEVVVTSAAARHNKHPGLLLGDKEGTGHDVVVAHVVDECAVVSADLAGASIIVPSKDSLDRGGVECLSVSGEGKTMVELPSLLEG